MPVAWVLASRASQVGLNPHRNMDIDPRAAQIMVAQALQVYLLVRLKVHKFTQLRESTHRDFVL